MGKTIADTMTPGEPAYKGKCVIVVHHGRYISRDVMPLSENVSLTHSSDFDSKNLKNEHIAVVVSKLNIFKWCMLYAPWVT